MAKGKKTGGRVAKQATQVNLRLTDGVKEMAKVIGDGNLTAGMERSVLAANALSKFKDAIVNVATAELKTLAFAALSLPKMPHQILGSDRVDQKVLDADLLRWAIQRELDSRKAGELPYTWGEMYLAMGIPKEFLR